MQTCEKALAGSAPEGNHVLTRDNGRVRRPLATLLLAGLLLLPHVSAAEVYRWVDDEGTTHYVTGLDRVPERYRAKAQDVSGSPRPAPDAPDTLESKTPARTFRFTPGAAILVSVKINGAGPLTLVLDTGADRTVVSPRALTRIGVPLISAAGAEVKGVTGSAPATVVWIDSLEVAGAGVGPLPIIAHDPDLKEADGLLGRDFLSRFSVTIDANTGTVTLTPH